MKPLKTFIIYSSKDKTLRAELENHLRPLVDLGWLELWSDKEIRAGERWDAAIKKQLAQAELFLMLVSVDFYNSGYIRDEEFKAAVARMEDGAALVIPIIVRHCSWKYFPIIKDLQILPEGGIPVTDSHWQHHDKAWDVVVDQIGIRVEALRADDDDESKKTSSAKVVSSDSKPEPKSSETAKPKFKNGDTFQDFPYSPEMVFVEGGTFLMGSKEYDDEQPVHEVSVPAFWMGKYPVTFDEYDRFCEDTGKEKPIDEGWGRGSRPVIKVSWQDAQFYCEWLREKTGKNYRLPSESEWEFAARGGTFSKGYEYAGGNDLLQVGWYRENSNNQSQPVGKKSPNELGIFDMSGNVWEWCQDHWHENYKGAPMGSGAWEGDNGGADRVLRGGSWYYTSEHGCVAARGYDEPAMVLNNIGFRIALSADE